MSVINTGCSSSVHSMSWVRELFLLSFFFNFHISASHIPSVDNVVPDFLSRFFYPKHTALIPLHLQWDLCCFRSGRVEDPVEVLPE